jgi:hypothetical protein
MVDTLYIGHFYENKESKVEFLISNDYFDAGKFKNKKLPPFADN